ncbi:PREDICTED: ribosomal RNA small subunit methyltransferase NEP1-like [Atta cephalotes]|uniref:Uncharacterized protein n=1 Tax=Atta cephalotes TaxID=12957 RepID=A0A158NP00_ATTCE|nr:PREDICTED: ribosomal RNA small subunit methyltransferase NEP1-like [Atta cephalotes]
MSFNARKVLNPRNLVPTEDPIAIVVGAMAHGQVKTDYTEDTYSICNYPLLDAIAYSKLCTAFEEVRGVV